LCQVKTLPVRLLEHDPCPEIVAIQVVDSASLASTPNSIAENCVIPTSPSHALIERRSDTMRGRPYEVTGTQHAAVASDMLSAALPGDIRRGVARGSAKDVQAAFRRQRPGPAGKR
jgi:hypothetical protein